MSQVGEQEQKKADDRSHATPPDKATDAVLRHSEPISGDAKEIRGIEFNDYRSKSITVDEIIQGMATMGFQASALAEAVDIINDMISWRDPSDTHARTTLFLGYTSNLVSSGLREVIRYLVQHRHVDVLVTTAGGVEEDLIKCLAPTYLGNFTASGASLRDKGINRIGNLFVPNDNYCKFEDWVVPIFDKMLKEQEDHRAEISSRNSDNSNKDEFEPPFVWTPSTIIARLGQELDDDRSIYTWAYRNSIPVFCPALTDGSLGDMLFFHSYRASPRQLTIDINADIRRINDIALKSKRAGIVIVGGGVVKHHIANACLMRNGADSAVYINTAQEFDGSDAGARPDEAVSWGKIRSEGRTVKVYAEATLVFPLIVAATFAKIDTEENAVKEREAHQNDSVSRAESKADTAYSKANRTEEDADAKALSARVDDEESEEEDKSKGNDKHTSYNSVEGNDESNGNGASKDYEERRSLQKDGGEVYSRDEKENSQAGNEKAPTDKDNIPPINEDEVRSNKTNKDGSDTDEEDQCREQRPPSQSQAKVRERDSISQQVNPDKDSRSPAPPNQEQERGQSQEQRSRSDHQSTSSQHPQSKESRQHLPEYVASSSSASASPSRSQTQRQPSSERRHEQLKEEARRRHNPAEHHQHQIEQYHGRRVHQLTEDEIRQRERAERERDRKITEQLEDADLR